MEKKINFNNKFSEKLLEETKDKIERMDRILLYKEEENGKAFVKFVFVSKKLSLIRKYLDKSHDIQETHGGDVLIAQCNYSDRDKMAKAINDFFKERGVCFHNVCDDDSHAEYVICEYMSEFKV